MAQEMPPAPGGGMGGGLQSRTLGEILTAGFEIYKEHWQKLIPIVAIVAIPAMIVTYFIQNLLIGQAVKSASDVQITTDAAGNTTISGGAVGASFTSSILALFIVQVLIMVVTLLLTAAIARAAAASIAGRDLTIQESYSFALKKLGPVFVASVLIGLGVVLGLIVFIIPGIFLAVKWAVTIPALVVEGKGATASMGRSWKLSEGNFWHVLGTWIVAAIIAGVVSAIIQAIFGFLGWFGRGLGAGVAEAVTIPFTASILVLLYVDLRVKKEQLTLEQFQQELSA